MTTQNTIYTQAVHINGSVTRNAYIVVVLDSGETIQNNPNTKTIIPNDDYSMEDPQTQAVCAAVFTDENKAQWANKITTLSINSVNATIVGNIITITLPKDTDLTNLIAVFTTNGFSVLVKDAPQVSGETANDFTESVRYDVSAANGSGFFYLVNVSLETV